MDAADCSPFEFTEHTCDAARAMREKKITEAAKDLHAEFFVMLHCWKDGLFDLPPLATIHMEAMEGKAIDLGKLLFRRNNEITE